MKKPVASVVRLLKGIAFLAFYLKELVRANLRIAVDIATPGLRIRPGFLAIPLRTRSDFELLIFANLVSMTPGTLSLDVDPERRFLFIHAMYVDDAEALRREIGVNLQNRLIEVFA